jgi:hypothetical protein
MVRMRMLGGFGSKMGKGKLDVRYHIAAPNKNNSMPHGNITRAIRENARGFFYFRHLIPTLTQYSSQKKVP